MQSTSNTGRQGQRWKFCINVLHIGRTVLFFFKKMRKVCQDLSHVWFSAVSTVSEVFLTVLLGKAKFILFMKLYASFSSEHSL